MGNTNETETKTRREWLEMLPEPYRSEAIKACIDEGSIDDIIEFKTAITGGFLWPDDEWKKWRRINSRWLSGEFLPKTDAQKYRYPWRLAPWWAVCAATDENGDAYWFGPRLYTRAYTGDYEQIYGQFDATDWRESLEMRPAEFQKQTKPEQ